MSLAEARQDTSCRYSFYWRSRIVLLQSEKDDVRWYFKSEGRRCKADHIMTDVDVWTHVVARSIGVAANWTHEFIKLTECRF